MRMNDLKQEFNGRFSVHNYEPERDSRSPLTLAVTSHMQLILDDSERILASTIEGHNPSRARHRRNRLSPGDMRPQTTHEVRMHRRLENHKDPCCRDGYTLPNRITIVKWRESLSMHKLEQNTVSPQTLGAKRVIYTQ